MIHQCHLPAGTSGEEVHCPCWDIRAFLHMFWATMWSKTTNELSLNSQHALGTSTHGASVCFHPHSSKAHLLQVGHLEAGHSSPCNLRGHIQLSRYCPPGVVRIKIALRYANNPCIFQAS